MLRFTPYRGMEQWLARWAHNPKAGGSNPSPANYRPQLPAEALFLVTMESCSDFLDYGGIAQLVRATES
jgi:hypothetical protein